MAANCERTFIAIKPDGVQRGLVGEIIKRFEQKGFRMVAMKFVHVSLGSRGVAPHGLRRLPRPKRFPSPARTGPEMVCAFQRGLFLHRNGNLMPNRPTAGSPGSHQAELPIEHKRLISPLS